MHSVRSVVQLPKRLSECSIQKGRLHKCAVLPWCFLFLNSPESGRTMRTLLRELDQHDLRMCAHAHRRSPRSGTVRGVHLQLPKGMQAIRVTPEDAPGQPREGEQLPTVSVA